MNVADAVYTVNENNWTGRNFTVENVSLMETHIITEDLDLIVVKLHYHEYGYMWASIHWEGDPYEEHAVLLEKSGSDQMFTAYSYYRGCEGSRSHHDPAVAAILHYFLVS